MTMAFCISIPTWCKFTCNGRDLSWTKKTENLS